MAERKEWSKPRTDFKKKMKAVLVLFLWNNHHCIINNQARIETSAICSKHFICKTWAYIPKSAMCWTLYIRMVLLPNWTAHLSQHVITVTTIKLINCVLSTTKVYILYVYAWVCVFAYNPICCQICAVPFHSSHLFNMWHSPQTHGTLLSYELWVSVTHRCMASLPFPHFSTVKQFANSKYSQTASWFRSHVLFS